MQQLEEALFAQGLPVAALMEQAGLGLAQAVLQHPGSQAPRAAGAGGPRPQRR